MVKNGASILDFIHFVQRIHFCSKKGYFNKQNCSPWVFFIFEKMSRGKSKPFLFVHVWIFPTAARFTGHFSGGILNLSRATMDTRAYCFPHSTVRNIFVFLNTTFLNQKQWFWRLGSSRRILVLIWSIPISKMTHFNWEMLYLKKRKYF